MIRKRKQCNHKFEVMEYFEGHPETMQLLICKICGDKYYGFGGIKGAPEYIHLISKNSAHRRALVFG